MALKKQQKLRQVQHPDTTDDESEDVFKNNSHSSANGLIMVKIVMLKSGLVVLIVLF